MAKSSLKTSIFIETIFSIKSKEQMVDFIEGILTQKELNALATRIEIVRLLKKNISQKKIAIKLKVGVATVTRGSKELQKGRFKYL